MPVRAAKMQLRTRLERLFETPCRTREENGEMNSGFKLVLIGTSSFAVLFYSKHKAHAFYALFEKSGPCVAMICLSVLTDIALH